MCVLPYKGSMQDPIGAPGSFPVRVEWCWFFDAPGARFILGLTVGLVRLERGSEAVIPYSTVSNTEVFMWIWILGDHLRES